MNKEFSLIPFTTPVADVEKVRGTIFIQNRFLTITYQVTGNIESLSIPRPSAAPVRRNGLWKESCFECFIQGYGHNHYHEMNLSPSGDWNMYYFSEYRSGMVEESAVQQIESTTTIQGNKTTICCSIPLNGCGLMESFLQVGISCVLLHGSGTLSYWALAHPGPKPDFHDARAFCITLE